MATSSQCELNIPEPSEETLSVWQVLIHDPDLLQVNGCMRKQAFDDGVKTSYF